MKINRNITSWSTAGLLLLAAGITAEPIAAEFVKLTVELHIEDWSYWSLEDGRREEESTRNPESIFRKPSVVELVVGTNRWMMRSDFYRNADVTRWFLGSNIVEETVITRELPADEARRIGRTSRLATASPPVGQKRRRVYQTKDGNPGRPVRVEDLMDLRGRICWLAFCSGPVLRQEGRRMYPPSDLWKQFVAAPDGFRDEPRVFGDELGLPRSLELFTPKEQLIFHYQVRQWTNFIGANIPLEFYAVQYYPQPTNQWEVQMLIKGKVTALEPGEEPRIPEAAAQSATPLELSVPADGRK